MQKLEINCLPKSLKEAREVGHNLYYTGNPCKHGHLTYRYVLHRACSECVKAKVKKTSTQGGGNARRWAAKTEEQLQIIYEKRKIYYKKTKEKRRAEKLTSYHKLKQNPEWMELRRKKINAYRAINGRPLEVSNPEVKRRYKQTEKGKLTSLANDAKRRTAKMRRTPAWLTEEDYWMIEQAYELAILRSKMFGFKWHVDHVIPLQGKNVSGFHVPTNLQVIPWIENISKANKYLPA